MVVWTCAEHVEIRYGAIPSGRTKYCRIMRSISNLILVILTVISFYVILYVGLGFGWPVGTSENYERINKVLENLSYSYLAGCIFYVLTVSVPYRLRRHKLDKVLHSKISIIVGKLQDSKQCVRSLSEFQNNIFLSDAEMLDRMESTSFSTPSSMSFFYGNNIVSYLNSQKKEILDLVYDLQRYGDLLSDKELKTLGELTDCKYFELLKIAGNPITDNPQIRRSTGEMLLVAEGIIKNIAKTY